MATPDPHNQNAPKKDRYIYEIIYVKGKRRVLRLDRALNRIRRLPNDKIPAHVQAY